MSALHTPHGPLGTRRRTLPLLADPRPRRRLRIASGELRTRHESFRLHRSGNSAPPGSPPSRTSTGPPKRTLSTREQKAELLAILDRAAQLKLNAIIFQVRPACDALYASRIEPWSEYLTGTMGKPPEPFYDPLAFAVEEAHKRGLELHAWFNPYRARLRTASSPVAATHVSKTHPQLVRQYGEFLWLDPGEKEVQDYSLNVVLDVVRRYDIDGVHFDDYFYPYKGARGDGKGPGFSRRLKLATLWRRRKAEPRGLAARERQHLHPARLLIDQGDKALGEVWHQPLRHLASRRIRRRSKGWTPTRHSTPTRANGWPTGGSITSRRNFTGR